MSDGRLDLLPSIAEITTITTTKRKSNKRNDIQFLRALAIIGVLAFHLKPQWIPQGFLGVDIFFVISGYLMTSILNFGPTRSLTCSSLNTFYLRRIKRIFPIYYLIIFLTLILCSPFLIEIDYDILKLDTLWSITFSSNIQSMFNEENYFQRLDEYKFLLHTWSLSVEIQYYLIAPFLLYGISCLSFPIIATVILIIGSWSFQAFYPNSIVTFGFVFCRLWQFLIGTIVFYFEKSYIPVFRSKRTTNLWYLISMAALISIIFTPISITFSSYLTVVARSITTLLTAFAIFLGTQHSLHGIIILSESLCLLGDLSYSVYLIHWPIIILFKYLLLFDRIYLIGIVAFIFLVSILQYQIFETRLQARSNSFVFGVIILLLTAIIATLFAPQGFGFISPKTYAKAVKENEQLYRHCNRQLEELRNCKMEPHFDIPSHKRPLDSYLCSYEGTGTATIMLTGNSFAMRQYEEIIKVSSHKFKKLYLVTQSMCTVFTRQNDPKWLCGYISNRLKEFMTVLKPDLMIVTQRLSVGNVFNTPLNSFEDAKTDSMTAIFKEYWREYSELTKKIIIVEPHLTFYDSPKENLAKLLSLNASLENYYIPQKAHDSEVNPGWWRTLASVEGCPKCSTVPIRQYFCHSNSECDIYDHRKLLTLYCDPGHLTSIGVQRFISDLAAAINKAI